MTVAFNFRSGAWSVEVRKAAGNASLPSLLRTNTEVLAEKEDNH